MVSVSLTYTVHFSLLQSFRRALRDERSIYDWHEKEGPKEPVGIDVVVQDTKNSSIHLPKTCQRIIRGGTPEKRL